MHNHSTPWSVAAAGKVCINSDIYTFGLTSMFLWKNLFIIPEFCQSLLWRFGSTEAASLLLALNASADATREADYAAFGSNSEVIASDVQPCSVATFVPKRGWSHPLDDCCAGRQGQVCVVRLGSTQPRWRRSHRLSALVCEQIEPKSLKC